MATLEDLGWVKIREVIVSDSSQVNLCVIFNLFSFYSFLESMYRVHFLFKTELFNLYLWPRSQLLVVNQVLHHMYVVRMKK